MKLLGIETATEACSAAVLIDDEVVERYEVAPRKHNELILHMCEHVMADAGVSLKQLDGIAFGCGPGAFTGVRIAAGVTQGIAFAQDLPVASVSTLANLAYQTDVSDGGLVMTAIDARMDEVYWAVYKKISEQYVELHGQESVQAPSGIMLDHRVTFGVGTGWGVYKEVLQKQIDIADENIKADSLPRARATVLLAKQKCLNHEVVDAEHALPVYLRNKVTHQR